jgi:hypothetical protein
MPLRFPKPDLEDLDLVCEFMQDATNFAVRYLVKKLLCLKWYEVL